VAGDCTVHSLTFGVEQEQRQQSASTGLFVSYIPLGDGIPAVACERTRTQTHAPM